MSVTAFRSAVPLWGPTSYILSGVPPKRDCSSDRGKGFVREVVLHSKTQVARYQIPGT